MRQVKPLFSANPKGKLLLSGEYAVLDGAIALAVPTVLGQRFEVVKNDNREELVWSSSTNLGEIWFSAKINTNTLEVIETSDVAVASTLVQMLECCKQLNPAFLSESDGFSVHTYLEFPTNWGLGSSSTLVAALGEWAKVSPYAVLEASLGGSGYDLACAFAESALFFTKNNTSAPTVELIQFKPPFLNQLYFVFLEKKQNSRAGIRQYQASTFDKNTLCAQISILTKAIARSVQLSEFMHHLRCHERLIAAVLGEKPVQERLFSDFQGQIKSLGAWGGDFVLVASRHSEAEIKAYFLGKGYPVCLPYSSLVLS